MSNSAESPESTDRLIEDLGEFVMESPSSYHAAEAVARRLVAAGFTQLGEHQDWSAAPESAGPGRYVLVRDGAVLAWIVPEGATPTTPVRILGAHTDSPGFKLKPRSTVLSHGWVQAGTEVYGGPLLNSWLDRELRLAGRLVTRDGATHLAATGPVARIPQLAIHLDRQVNEGLKLGKQAHTTPVLSLAGSAQEAAEADVLKVIADAAGVAADEVDGYDVVVADSQQPGVFGAEGEFFASGRLDNLSSVHAGVVALEQAAEEAASGEAIPMLAAFDHEELGSASRSGAAGPFLEEVLGRIYAGLGATVTQRAQALAASWHLSSDAGHAVHPNYAERHDPANRPLPNGGPLLKINANQRYTTDAPGAAMWVRVCRDAGVPTQEFVSNNDIPCGSTIGPITATRLGIRTVDVGIPLLSMHSAREMCGVEDVVYLTRAVRSFFTAELG
ncbi:M18 family aminopeptidase [Nesterenkonia lacusekhoensis]|uniref:M18 family aminopeptidase n=1 Tax=Nesterenkonia lacusekhoensis TaxID=150832 RepID=A0ABS4T4I8_9MICC|nr:M18 family aminopeptidase [Nesterenkonia lacusekhoensis]MBP2319352.1 aspartyl aminopeptidase [Nesterenkonia lacusekhoensis]